MKNKRKAIAALTKLKTQFNAVTNKPETISGEVGFCQKKAQLVDTAIREIEESSCHALSTLEQLKLSETSRLTFEMRFAIRRPKLAEDVYSQEEKEWSKRWEDINEEVSRIQRMIGAPVRRK